jgi:transcriptional regulator with XRE-family HTH domain
VQEDVARSIGTDWMRISRYERGPHLPTADNIVALARVLRVTTDALLLGQREEEDAIEFNNLRLCERFRALDQLPRDEHEAIVRIVNAVLAKYAYENVTERSRRAS